MFPAVFIYCRVFHNAKDQVHRVYIIVSQFTMKSQNVNKILRQERIDAFVSHVLELLVALQTCDIKERSHYPDLPCNFNEPTGSFV